jgi:hypothetical protein
MQARRHGDDTITGASRMHHRGCHVTTCQSTDRLGAHKGERGGEVERAPAYEGRLSATGTPTPSDLKYSGNDLTPSISASGSAAATTAAAATAAAAATSRAVAAFSSLPPHRFSNPRDRRQQQPQQQQQPQPLLLLFSLFLPHRLSSPSAMTTMTAATSKVAATFHTRVEEGRKEK